MLSLVMEKDARERLEKIQEARKKAGAPVQKDLLQKRTPKKSPPGKRPLEKSLGEKLDESAAKLSEPDQLLDALRRLEKSLDGGVLDSSAPNTPPALKQASRQRGAPKMSPKISPGREALIRHALATRRDKEKLLDDLSPEEKLKLHLMAKKMMTPGKK